MKRGGAADSGWGIYDHSVFLIADTLTLRFDEDRVLVALDAYSNSSRWSEANDDAPVEPEGRGQLTIDWQADSDRVVLQSTPTFALAQNAHSLHIYLDSAPAAHLYDEVGTGLTVGLAAGAIRENIVTDLTLM